MPRRQYISDLKAAEQGVSIAGISHVEPGNDDGEFTFLCMVDGQQRKISALVTDVSEYPSSHVYMIFVEEAAPTSVARAIDGLAEIASGNTIYQLLELTSQKLASKDEDGDEQMLNSQISSVQDHDSLVDEDSDDGVDDFFPDDYELADAFSSQRRGMLSSNTNTSSTPSEKSRIRADLSHAKAAGFKVGSLGGLFDHRGCYVTLSCRIAKLGISEEAMKAWQVEPSEYLVVILSYPGGYETLENIMRYDVSAVRRHFGVRIGICSTYKPTMVEAVKAFTVLSKEEEMRNDFNPEVPKDGQKTPSESPNKGFRNSFISRPLHDLLDNRFAQLLRYRLEGMTWNGAEDFFHDIIRAKCPNELVPGNRHTQPEAECPSFPSIVTADHITEAPVGDDMSLPLVAMQFVLRHFVRCTEFCLICFRKMSDELQAIKPYVCDSELCLYQYMSLGFGPSIEHEILSQPKVVDLLISFCYTSAFARKLSDFPSGLRFMVPPSAAIDREYGAVPPNQFRGYQYPPISTPVVDTNNVVAASPTPIKYSVNTNEIMFAAGQSPSFLRAGDWVVIRMDNTLDSKPFHCRVVDASLYPTITVSKPIRPKLFSDALNPDLPKLSTAKQHEPWQSASKPVDDFKMASLYKYDQNFDSLSPDEKRQAIHALLDLMPSIDEMREFLTHKNQSRLTSWVNRMSPAGLGLLRWIIASNRACIMQVEEDSARTKGCERLYGMPGWTQFRFAMGAPDKERRFVQSVRETALRKNLQHETLFAWHGSPLQNWHSIIREGLHFRDTAHGRAFGNGVYHSLQQGTSMSYSGGVTCYWPKSSLKVTCALALNEIVAAPDEYVSKTPHLVVAQLDWIQTRYLFVNSKSGHSTSDHSALAKIPKELIPSDPIDQDMAYTPMGVSEKLIIPKSAIPSHRNPDGRQSPNRRTVKRRKTLTGKSVYNPVVLDGDDDDGASVATLNEDRLIFEEDAMSWPSEDTVSGAPHGVITPNSTKSGGIFSMLKSAMSKPRTDYVPGKLDYNTLPMLAEPSFATMHATRRLMQDFKQMINVQKQTPAHELGWHIDEDKVENMYQWIVELHSFDAALPLAKDLKISGLTSVVLEMRFGKDYPMSPPFVRVIRPRFLGFQQGGGGHVTAGGALCMQLLTNDGWSAVSSIESVLLQVRMAMSSTEPKPARLERGVRQDYGVGEAVEAYIRACNVHGWTIPAGFRETALGGLPTGQM